MRRVQWCTCCFEFRSVVSICIYKYDTDRKAAFMPERKTELVSFRVTPTFKRALKLAAENDARSQANFLEKLVLDYCTANKLGVTTPKRRTAKALTLKATVRGRA